MLLVTRLLTPVSAYCGKYDHLDVQIPEATGLLSSPLMFGEMKPCCHLCHQINLTDDKRKRLNTLNTPSQQLMAVALHFSRCTNGTL